MRKSTINTLSINDKKYRLHEEPRVELRNLVDLKKSFAIEEQNTTYQLEINRKIIFDRD